VLVGLLHRRAAEAGPDSPRDPAWLARRAVGAVATLAYAANEVHDYEFGVADTWVMAVFVIGVSGLLLRFTPRKARWQPGGFAAAILAFCGRRSLEIYIAQIVGLMALGAMFGVEPADRDGDEE
jgi:peptidoglycan/LPS O-acetylase OafA/YrhL